MTSYATICAPVPTSTKLPLADQRRLFLDRWSEVCALLQAAQPTARVAPPRLASAAAPVCTET